MDIKEIKTVRGVSLKLDRVEKSRLEVLSINKSFIISAKLVAPNLDVIKEMVEGKPFNASVKRAYKGFFGNIAKAFGEGKLDKDGLTMLSQIKTNKELFKVMTATKKTKSLKEAILVTQADKPAEAKPKSKAKDKKMSEGEQSPLVVALEMVKKMSEEDIKGIKEALKGIIKDAPLKKMKAEQAYIIFEALKAAQLY